MKTLPTGEILRTPEDRFADLPDFPWQAKRTEALAGLSMAYLDEGSSDAEHTFLCLHGQPTWSYLYRKMIPVFLAAGGRVVAPDLYGFGRSDKPSDEAFYTFDRHRESLLAFIENLDLQNITFVIHDWGGILGLTLPMEAPQRYARLLVSNTVLATGEVPMPQGFLDWRAFVARTPDLDVGKLMARACPTLSEAERAAYDAPFPDATYKAGVRRFPQLVADHFDAPGAETARRAVAWWKSEWSGPSFMAVGMDDPVLGGPAMAALRRAIRDCPKALRLEGVGHFVPDQAGEDVAREALAAWAAASGLDTSLDMDISNPENVHVTRS